MKQIRQTWKGLLVALIVTSGILIACQKDAKSPDVTSAAKGTSRPTVPCNTYQDCNFWARTLVAGQNIIVGDYTLNIGGGVTVYKDGDNLVVSAKIGEGMNYCLNELHVYIGTDAGLDGPGKSVSPGQFPYKATPTDPNECTKELSVTVPISELTANDNGCYTVAVHAALSGINGTQGETAWGCGDKILGDITGGNWGTKFTICIQEDCTTPPPPTGPCTLSQGYWLANTGTGQVRQYINWGSGVTFGSVTLQKDEVVAYFPAKTNTLLKALFQATALQLDVNMTSLEWSDVPADVKAAYDFISNTISNAGSLENYLKIKNQTTIKSLQTAASTISNYIKANHCQTAIYDTQTDAGTI